MKVFSSAVKYLASLHIKSTKVLSVYSGAKYFPFTATFPMRIFSYFLGIKEGFLAVVATENQEAEKRFLEELKADGVLDSYFEPAFFCDYPKVYALGINYSREQGKTFRTWGYVRTNEDRTLAYTKAIGELLERDAEYYVAGKNPYRPSFDLHDVSDLYSCIPKFTQTQCDRYHSLIASYDDLKSLPSLYVKGIGSSSRYLPASLFYWGMDHSVCGKVISHPTSSGGGGGFTYDEALLSAVYELIERDHFLLYWFSGVLPRRINNGTIPGEFGRYVASLEKDYYLQVYFLDLRYDSHAKVVACVIIDPILNIIAMGAKASMSPIETLRSSLLEALAVMMELREKKLFVSEMELKEILMEHSFNKDINASQRTQLYCSSFGIGLIIKHFLSGEFIAYSDYEKGYKVFSSKNDEVEALKDHVSSLVKEKGEEYTLYTHTLHSSLTKKYGYHVVKAYCPAFIPLHLVEYLATPVSPRLEEFGRIHGKHIHGEEGIVTLPHFFP